MTSADKFVRPSVCPEAPRRTCAMLTVSSSLQISYAIRKSQPTTGSIFPLSLSLSIAYLISNCLPADSLCSWSYSIKENQLWIKVIIAEEGARGNEGVYNEGRVIKKFSWKAYLHAKSTHVSKGFLDLWSDSCAFSTYIGIQILDHPVTYEGIFYRVFMKKCCFLLTLPRQHWASTAAIGCQ